MGCKQKDSNGFPGSPCGSWDDQARRAASTIKNPCPLLRGGAEDGGKTGQIAGFLLTTGKESE